MIITGCNSQNDKTDHIKSFLEKVVIVKSNDLNQINAFLNLPDDALKPGTKTYELIQFNIQFLSSELDKHNGEYEILTYETFKSREVFKPYIIKYEEKDHVYCIVRGAHLITPIIIDDNNKIIAFFTGIVKNKDNIVPYVLEQK